MKIRPQEDISKENRDNSDFVLTRRNVQALNGGLFICPGYGRHGDRVIDSYELIFVRQGVLTMWEESKSFTIKPGQTLLLWPGRRHGGSADYPQELEFYWIHFRVEHQDEQENAPLHRDILRVPQVATPARQDRLTELYHQFLYDQENGTSHILQNDLMMMLMLCETARLSTTAESESAATTLAARADAYMAKHFHQDIHTASIAEELQCNADYLGRVYQKHFGITLTEALQTRRTQFAKRLLRESNLSIEQIVVRCGFNDPAYFRRIFRRQTGVTPGTFRKLHSRVHINLS